MTICSIKKMKTFSHEFIFRVDHRDGEMIDEKINEC
jgi:hypothetical protein